MKELSDKEFDQVFKNKIKEGYPEYEEGSWLKMEEKLRKRDRFVFLRNASIILLFLSFGIGIYLISGERSINENKIVKKSNSLSPKNNLFNEPNVSKPPTNKNEYAYNSSLLTGSTSLPLKNKIGDAKNSETFLSVNESKMGDTKLYSNEKPEINPPPNSQSEVILGQAPTNSPVTEVLIEEKVAVPGKTHAKKVKFPITLSINVGPDFSSTENAIGGKSGVALGVGIGVGLSQKLSLQTGINYGTKNYKAEGYDYTFNNPNTVNSIAGIDAACKVLEIPLRASYTIMDNQKNSIDLNAGLSSYFMLKENYRFIYTAASGRSDRFLERKNSNQHYLSVIDLSATYNIKLKNKKFALGVQPYMKIPVTGIGEGNLPLKSSGISLKLNYELNKKK